jgi:hypothetical protein
VYPAVSELKRIRGGCSSDGGASRGQRLFEKRGGKMKNRTIWCLYMRQLQHINNKFQPNSSMIERVFQLCTILHLKLGNVKGMDNV